MYYLDAFLHDLMSQVSQMSFYCEPRWMKCDELLHMRVSAWHFYVICEKLVAIEWIELRNNIVMEVVLLKVFVYLFFIFHNLWYFLLKLLLEFLP